MRVKSYASIESVGQDIRQARSYVKMVTKEYQEKSNILAFVSFDVTANVQTHDILKDSTLYIEALNKVKRNLNNIRLSLYADYQEDPHYKNHFKALNDVRQLILSNESLVVDKLKDTFENKAPKSLLNLANPLYKELSGQIECRDKILNTYVHTTEDGLYYSRFLELSSVVDVNNFKYPRLHIGISKFMGSKTHLKCGVKTDRFDPTSMKTLRRDQVKAYITGQLSKLNVL